jgi:hypothetical protein
VINKLYFVIIEIDTRNRIIAQKRTIMHIYIYIEDIDKRVCHVRVCDVFNMKHVMSVRVYIFGRACFNVSKF